jgi:transposase
VSYQHHHIAFRRGKKRAAVALGHTLLTIIYHVIADEKGYEELGGDYLDQVDRQGLFRTSRAQPYANRRVTQPGSRSDHVYVC